MSALQGAVYLSDKRGLWALYEGDAAMARMAALGIALGDGARIGDGACIGDRASIGVDGRVPRTATHHVMGPLGSDSRMLTGYRGSNGEIRAATGCFDGTMEEFESRVREYSDTEHGRRYLAAAQALRSLVADLTPGEIAEVTP